MNTEKVQWWRTLGAIIHCNKIIDIMDMDQSETIKKITKENKQKQLEYHTYELLPMKKVLNTYILYHNEIILYC